MGRVDVGIAFKPAKRGGELALDGAEIERLLHAVLAEKIHGAWQPKAAPAGDDLALIGPQVGATLLRATTSAKMRRVDGEPVVDAAGPTVAKIVEFDGNSDARALPPKAKPLSLPRLWDEGSVRVHFYSLNREGIRDAGVVHRSFARIPPP